MFDKIALFFEGRVLFCASEGFQDMFLEACTQMNVALYRLHVLPGKITAEVKYADYSTLLRAAKKSGMRMECIRNKGLKPLIGKYRLRVGIPVGMLAGAIVFQILSSVLWSVEVTGLERINNERFTEFLKTINVQTGTFLQNIDCNEIERLAESYDENILRVTVNLVGSKLYVCVKERTLPPQMDERGAYCNIIAAKDGEILSADYFAGEGMAAPGDAVLQGDLLASGIETLQDGTPRYLKAQALVMARTRNAVCCSAALQLNAQKVTGVKDAFSIRFFGLDLPPRQGGVNMCSLLNTPDTVFPIGLVRNRKTASEASVLHLSKNKALLVALNDLAVAAAERFSQTEIERTEVSAALLDQMIVEAVFICREDISLPQYFETLPQ